MFARSASATTVVADRNHRKVVAPARFALVLAPGCHNEDRTPEQDQGRDPAEVRATLERVVHERPGIGGAPIFPDPRDRTKPIDRYLADRWLRKAEELADLEPQKRGLWHPYRRAWATKRKHLPDVDVAAAGGWSDLRSLKTAY